jgi:SAM-dependent methyltransferase
MIRLKGVFNEVLRKGDPRFRFIASLQGAAVVLDLGCGTGNNSRLIRELFPATEVHGVDLLKAKALPGYVKFSQMDLDTGNALPFRDNIFDAILFTHVIEHLRDPLRLGSEIHRVLKRGGTLYVEAPNWTSLLVPSIGFKKEQGNPFNFYDDPTHLKPWSKLGIAGFVMESCRLELRESGNARNKRKLVLDPFYILAGLLAGRRHRILSGVGNLVGWSVFGIGKKASEPVA